MGTNSLLIIGLGNEYRHDDAVGLLVARNLQGRTPAGVSVLELSSEGAALLEAWQGYSTVFLIDAVYSNAPPGTIHRLDALAGPIPACLFHCSTHAFNIAEAIELARALHQLPSCLQVFGIEAKDYAVGLGLSAEVEQAAAAVTREILDSVSNAKAQDREKVSPSQG